MSWRLVRRVRFLLACVMVATPLEGQTPPAAPSGDVFLVAYVDIRPSGREATIAAIRRYREAVAAEASDARVEAFEQIGRPGRFALLERWRDQAGADAHGATAQARGFREALQPLRVSGYDERPYRVLSVSMPRSSEGGRPVFVVTHVDIAGAAAQAEAPALLRRLAETSRAEPGNLRFDVLQHATRLNHYTIIETWRDEAAMYAHAAEAHTRTYREQVQPMSGSPIDERVYTEVN